MDGHIGRVGNHSALDFGRVALSGAVAGVLLARSRAAMARPLTGWGARLLAAGQALVLAA